MASTQAGNQVSLKLLVHKEKNKVLFAEAEKDFVDVLFSFLTLPLGTIVKLVGKESNLPPVTVGCLSTLYANVAKLDKNCLRSKTCKEMLLHPRNPMEVYRPKMKLNVDGTESLNYFAHVYRYCDCMSAFRNIRCSCGRLMDTEADLASLSQFGCGFVTETTFIICDDLYVMPNALENSLALLQKHGIQNTDAIVEQTVIVSKNEILDLLKSSLLSKTPLTDVFLTKKRTLDKFNQWNPSQLEIGQIPNDSGMNMDVKVMVRKSNKKIVMVQAEEDFANFILSFLTFPLGGLLSMLQRCPSFSCLEQLYKSLLSLREDKYFKSKVIKDRLAIPDCTFMCRVNGSFSPIRLVPSVYDSFYYKFVTPDTSTNYVGSSFEGFVKGPSMFMVTDDLVVNQMSSASCLSYFNGADVPICDLEQRVIRIGLNEGLSILKASLISQSALTNGLHQLGETVKKEK